MTWIFKILGWKSHFPSFNIFKSFKIFGWYLEITDNSAKPKSVKYSGGILDLSRKESVNLFSRYCSGFWINMKDNFWIIFDMTAI